MNANLSDIIRQIRSVDKGVVVELCGQIDMNNSVELRGALLQTLESSPEVLIVHLGDVEFMDSSGLATLVEGLKQCNDRKCALRLCQMQARVKSVFEIARLDTLFPIFDTEAEALAA